MPMTDPGDLGSPNPSPFATRPSVTTPEAAATPNLLDEKTVETLFTRLQELKRRRTAAPAAPSTPSLASRFNWDDMRRKGWHAALIIGSAYISAKPEKYGWLMPVLTAVAGTSAPPLGKPGTGVAAVLATMLLTLGWRAWV